MTPREHAEALLEEPSRLGVAMAQVWALLELADAVRDSGRQEPVEDALAAYAAEVSPEEPLETQMPLNARTVTTVYEEARGRYRFVVLACHPGLEERAVRVVLGLELRALVGVLVDPELAGGYWELREAPRPDPPSRS